MVSILVAIPGADYALRLHNIVVYLYADEAEASARRMLYVTLNKTHKSLREQFEEDGIDTGRIHFIDAISSTVMRISPAKNCTFIPVDTDLDRLHDLIVRQVKEHALSIVIFDSLSSLAVYWKSGDIMRFVPRLIASLSLLDCSVVLAYLASDERKREIQHLEMSVDRHIRMPKPGP